VVREESIAAGGVPISLLAQVLSQRLRAPVVDRTSLRGDYSFRVEFGRAPGTGVVPAAAPLTPTNPPRDPRAVPLVAALENQLGLTLEPQRGSVDVLVIDDATRPLD
jgi:uncharacterized protein (TIGR03435 family)